MCGIGGWLGAVPDGGHHARCMAKALRHRGPDDEGVWSCPEATLVHTRLSIIDLSPAGAQPLSNEDGSVWVVFNGEIYNHHELRKDLEMRGHILKGHSDTQVLPHLYEEYRLRFCCQIAWDVCNCTLRYKNSNVDFGTGPVWHQTDFLCTCL